ncbi:rCG24642, partial [Rattus norvegicus]|jgi:hypothetical protein
MVIW